MKMSWRSASHWVICVVGVCAMTAGAFGQSAPLQQREIDMHIDSGIVMPGDGDGSEAQVVFSHLVREHDAPWLRLRFADVQLGGSLERGTGSYLRLTSLQDGAHQILDAVSVQQWRLSSAYFNGDAILVELLAYPSSGTGAIDPQGNRLVISTVLTDAGDGDLSLTICDGVDERVLSNDPRDARSLPVGCTTWLFNQRHYCLLTAGHCAAGTEVAEFNVPIQGSGGGWVFAHPNDQYAVDPESKQVSSGPGGCTNDWSYFGVFPNSNTGLTPLQAQGGSYPLAGAAPPVSGQDIRIRGYGTTSSPVPPSWNRAQKEHSGPFVFSSGTTIRYRVDTTGGNSGSAVIDLSTNLAIGIHTCGGCTSGGGSNLGTAIHQPGLAEALSNPQGVCAWPPPAPSNNVCSGTIVLPEGVTAFDTFDATTTGPDEGEACTFFGDSQVHADVWFGHIAQCTGSLTISLCDSSYATKLAVYNVDCPEAPGSVIACNAGACGTNALVTIPVVAGEAFRIRVGGHAGAQGAGLIDISCEPTLLCTGDLNGDGQVDVSDLLVLLGSWGECSGCEADLTGDGVVDVSDMLALLGNWGACR